MSSKLPFPRYIRRGECSRCGWCCLKEDCEHLAWNGDTATCKIYGDPSRPEKCELFPEMPPILNPRCGYWFVDKWSNDKVLRVREV